MSLGNRDADPPPPTPAPSASVISLLRQKVQSILLQHAWASHVILAASCRACTMTLVCFARASLLPVHQEMKIKAACCRRPPKSNLEHTGEDFGASAESPGRTLLHEQLLPVF